MNQFLNLCRSCVLFALLVFQFVKTQAQTDTATTQKLLQYIMQPLDKSQIPTGFLEEYGCPMLPMATFNGTLTDSNRIDMNLWRTLYFQLQTGWARTTSNPLPAITNVNASIKSNSGDTILIPLLISNYNTVKPNAFSANLLSYNSSQNKVYDVPGRTQSPYLLNNLFAACPLKKITVKGAETFIIKSNAIWNTTGKTISQLQIDFANGQGFQTISINTPVSVTYTDTGYKRWTIKATLSDNTVLQSYNDYYVLKAISAASRFETPQSTIPAWGFVNPVAGVHGGAIVWVNYSNRNRTNTLRKPLIVVEGYDVSTIAPNLQPNYDISDFIFAINEPRNTYDFNGQLDDVAGYDLVFIDFNDGADDIVRNAAIVQEVINRVNANKVNDNRFGNIRQQNVVMGLSMGGLCARYALANMTKNFPGTPTEARLLITHDSPHRGANVPLGMQYLIRMMGNFQLFGFNIFDIYPEYNEAIGLLNAPATQQLLLYRATTTNSFAPNTFLDATYRPMITFAPTDPQPTYRFIATSLGNECAHPIFNPGKTFINLGAGVSAGITGQLLFFRVPILTYKLAAEVEAYALPNAGSTNKIARLYTINNLKLFGFINIFRQLYNNTAYAPGNHLAVDGVPGSVSPLLDVEAFNQLTSLPIFNPISLYVQFPLGPVLGGYFGIYAYNAGVAFDFTFVPAGSALDVSPYNTAAFAQQYVNGTNQSHPSSSETFIAQETSATQAVSNNVHIRFTARNARWLYNEMEVLPNAENCSNECSNTYYIKGDNIVCASKQFIISGYPRGAAVTWTVTPAGIATIQGNGNMATLTKISDGSVTITASINACGQNGNISKIIIVGAPTAPSITPYNYDAQCGSFAEAYCTQPQGATGYKWDLNYGQVIQEQDGAYANYFYTAPLVSNPQEGLTYYNYLTVQAKNACGLSAASATIPLTVGPVPSSCGGGGGGILLRVSPNPSNNAITVETTDNKTFTELRIYDKMGNIKKIVKYPAGTTRATVNIGNLTADTYTIRVLRGQQWRWKGFIKQ